MKFRRPKFRSVARLATGGGMTAVASRRRPRMRRRAAGVSYSGLAPVDYATADGSATAVVEPTERQETAMALSGLGKFKFKKLMKIAPMILLGPSHGLIASKLMKKKGLMSKFKKIAPMLLLGPSHGLIAGKLMKKKKKGGGGGPAPDAAAPEAAAAEEAAAAAEPAAEPAFYSGPQLIAPAPAAVEVTGRASEVLAPAAAPAQMYRPSFTGAEPQFVQRVSEAPLTDRPAGSWESDEDYGPEEEGDGEPQEVFGLGGGGFFKSFTKFLKPVVKIAGNLVKGVVGNYLGIKPAPDQQQMQQPIVVQGPGQAPSNIPWPLIIGGGLGVVLLLTMTGRKR